MQSAQPVKGAISHLISTFQVSSAKLERKRAPSKKTYVPPPGIEPGPPDCRGSHSKMFGNM